MQLLRAPVEKNFIMSQFSYWWCQNVSQENMPLMWVANVLQRMRPHTGGFAGENRQRLFFHTSPHFFTNAYFGLIQFSVYLLNLNEIFTLRDIFFTPILLIFVIRWNQWRWNNGRIISCYGDHLFRIHRSAVKTLREGVGGSIMEIFYWIGGIVAFGLLVYLTIALLKPEIFSWQQMEWYKSDYTWPFSCPL